MSKWVVNKKKYLNYNFDGPTTKMITSLQRRMTVYQLPFNVNKHFFSVLSNFYSITYGNKSFNSLQQISDSFNCFHQQDIQPKLVNWGNIWKKMQYKHWPTLNRKDFFEQERQPSGFAAVGQCPSLQVQHGRWSWRLDRKFFHILHFTFSWPITFRIIC